MPDGMGAKGMVTAGYVKPLAVPHGLEAIKRTFGDFTWKPMAPPTIDIDDVWESDNLVRIRNVCGTKIDIRLHRLAVEPFQSALEAAMKAAPKYKVRLLGGYCARQMKTLDPKKQAKAPLSTHAWGIAFDINWDKNPFASVLKTDLPPEFVAEFKRWGWSWGGDWSRSKDAMHFQLASGY